MMRGIRILWPAQDTEPNATGMILHYHLRPFRSGLARPITELSAPTTLDASGMTRAAQRLRAYNLDDCFRDVRSAFVASPTGTRQTNPSPRPLRYLRSAWPAARRASSVRRDNRGNRIRSPRR